MDADLEDVRHEDQRAAPRVRCLREGRCVLRGDYTALSVLIRNMSRTGVGIAVTQPIMLPDRFELWIHVLDGGYAKRPVRRVWTDGDRAGLAFLDAE